MRFQWYIISLEEPSIRGTNDVEKAEPFLDNEDYLVLTAQHGQFFHGSRDLNDVKELGVDEEDDDEEPGPDGGDDEDAGDGDGDDEETKLGDGEWPAPKSKQSDPKSTLSDKDDPIWNI